MHKVYDKSGFSLMELLIVTAILGVIMGGLHHVLVTSLNSYGYAEKKKNRLSQARNVMERMVRFVEATDDIAMPDGTGQDRLEISERLLDTYDNIAHVYAVDGDGFLDADADADGLINENESGPSEYVTFTVDKTDSTNWKLIETRPDYGTSDAGDTASGQVLCEKVVDFTCNRLAPYLVEIRLTLNNGEEEVSLSTHAVSRLMFMENRFPKTFGGPEPDYPTFYIADADNSRIRKVDGATSVIITVAGNESSGYSGDDVPATTTKLNRPKGLWVDGAGNLYIADTDNSRIRKVDAASNIITTVAGTGSAGYSGDDVPAATTKLNKPRGICLDGAGNLYIADTENSRIRKVDAATNIITTQAGCASRGYGGDDGPALDAMLNKPAGVGLDQDGSIYVSDTDNSRIRRVDAATNIITTVAGTGSAGYNGDGTSALEAALNKPVGIWVVPSH